MKKRLLVALLTVSMVFCNTSFLYAAEEEPVVSENEVEQGPETADVSEEISDGADSALEGAAQTEEEGTADSSSIKEEEEQEDITEAEAKNGSDEFDTSEILSVPGKEQKAVLEEKAVGAEEDNVVASGTCGDNANLTWVIFEDESKYILKISGTGKMQDYSTMNGITTAPWRSYSHIINKIIIEEGVTSIGDSAFYNCNTLKEELIIPNSVTTIGEFAFYSCTGFTGNLSIPESVSIIENNAFNGCSGFTGDLLIPDSVAEIGDNAFANCNFTSGADFYRLGSCGANGNNLRWIVTKGENDTVLTIMGRGEMRDYSSKDNTTTAPWVDYLNIINKVVIDEGVTRIGNKAFYGCSDFTGTLTIIDTIISIGDNAFNGCSGFSEIIIGSRVNNIGNGAFSGCEGLTGTLIIPNSVISIGDDAFNGCSSLSGLVIGTNVSSIGSNAFYNCKNLSGELAIPESIVSIGDDAFENCGSLKGAIIKYGYCGAEGNNICYIVSRNVNGNYGPILTIKGTGKMQDFSTEDIYYGTTSAPWGTKIWGVIIENGVTSIGNYAFSGCSLSGTLLIPASVTSIGNKAFSRCTSLKGELIIPDSVTSIGDYAFSLCSGLTGSLTIPDSVTSIGNGAFNGCEGFTGTLTIPDGITSIGDYAFYGCSGLTDIHIIPDSVTRIGNYAFTRCSGLTGPLTIPDGVISIGDYAFSGCKGFTGDLTIPDSVTSIGDYAFSECSGLTGALSIGNSVTGIGVAAFYYCTGLTGALTIPDGVTNIGGSAFYECRGFTGPLTIPDSVTSIGGCAFFECMGLTGALTIPDSVTSIGAQAFYKCSGLKGPLTIGNSVANIGNSAFSDCNGLTGTLTIPESVIRIGNYAFSSCQNLTGVLTIPDSVTSIGDGAFYDCIGFTGDLIIPDSITSIGADVFHSCLGLTGSLRMGNNVTSIGNYAFFGCSGLTGNLTIPDSVTSIGNYAFFGCTSLTGDLKIPDGVFSIGNYAFGNCWGLTGNLLMPESVTSIGGHLFSDCRQLNSITIPESVVNIDEQAFTGYTGTIKVINGSYAEEFARNNELNYISICKNHVFGDWIVLKEACCTEVGKKEKNCSVCGETIQETIPETGHKWNADYTVDKVATCTEEGSESIHCSVCDTIDESSIRVISKKAHAYGDWTVTKAATCTEAGSQEKICADCRGKITEEIPATGHKWEIAYTVDKAATCTEEGSESIHCSVCDAIDESTVRAIPKKAHAYGKCTVTKGATCTETGTQEKICADCGAKVTEEIPATGHKWETVYTVDKTATCTEEGSESIHCSVCGAIDESTVRTIPKKAHAYGDWTVTKAATCTEAGSQEKVCADCGDKTTEAIPATGHQWKTAYTADKEATCTEEGTESIHCSVCDEKKEGSERAIEKLEHTFGSWTVAKEPTATEPGTEERSCTLCGEKEQREYWEGYDITYVLNGGTNHAENPNSYYKKATITLKNPSKTGYTFGGWYSDAKFKKKVTTVSGGDKTVYAKWTVNKYSVAFNGNGSTSGKMSKMSGIAYDANKTLTGNAFKRTGYNFIGWNTAKDGSGTAYTNKQTITKLSETNGATINLYAQWEIIPYTISYNLGSDDAVNSDANPTSYDVTTAITLQAPTRPFSTFQGWYSDKKLKKKATTIKKGSTGNKTFYAKWTTNKYTITFKGNGSTSGKMKDLTGIVYNADKTLTANAFKRTGYHFVEWNTAADGSGTSYANKQVVNGLSTENGVKIVLYAIWEKDIYTISYVLNGSDAVNAAENPATYDVETAVTLTAPTREHYTFNGWYSDKKLKKKASTIKKGSTGNKTFYAKWTPNKYTIAYNGNGSTGGKMKNTTGVAYGSSKKLTGNAYSRKGYKFIGWNTAADGSGTSYANKASVLNLAEDNGVTVTLYAQWEIENYKITYNLNGGTAPEEGNPATYTVADETITLAAPAKTGYTFSGWYSDKKLKKKAPTITKGSTGNKTFYAKWTANKYTIVFDGNGATSGSTKKISGVAYGSSKKLTANGFKKTGATFQGWNTEPDGSGTTYKNKASVKNLTAENGATVTLYAMWSN